MMNDEYGVMGSFILVITGPTAVGKTEVGIACALALGGEILSADSRQVYNGMDIGTAKPAPEQLAAVPHHFINHVSPFETYTAGRYFKEAAERIERLLSRGKTPVVVGGSGLYVRTLTEGIFDSPEEETRIQRAGLTEELAERGAAALHEELAALDPEAASAIDAANHRRLLRALEVCRATGRPFSAVKRERMQFPAWIPFVCGLHLPRAALYRRIDERADSMLRAGLVEETRKLLDAGADPGCAALNTVGYKEALAYLKGSITRDEMAGLVRQHTRNYAKRQLTWFRKEKRIKWYDVGVGAEEAARVIIGDFMRASGNVTKWERRAGR